MKSIFQIIKLKKTSEIWCTCKLSKIELHSKLLMRRKLERDTSATILPAGYDVIIYFKNISSPLKIYVLNFIHGGHFLTTPSCYFLCQWWCLSNGFRIRTKQSRSAERVDIEIFREHIFLKLANISLGISHTQHFISTDF